MFIIWLLKYILFYFFRKGISIKSSKRISNDDQISFCKQVALYLVAVNLHSF